MIVRNSLGKFWQILTKAHPHFHIQGIAFGMSLFGIACNLDVKRRSHEKKTFKILESKHRQTGGRPLLTPPLCLPSTGNWASLLASLFGRNTLWNGPGCTVTLFPPALALARAADELASLAS